MRLLAATRGNSGTTMEVNVEGNMERVGPKYNKRKIALLLMYKGTGYSGLQVNKGFKTIEGEVHDAIMRAGGISRENENEFQKLSWGRSARTDKGVHAAGNVV